MFLDYMLGRLGFGLKWRNWMCACYGLVVFSIMINGVFKGFFKTSRGLRQGDPLSPYLFIMIPETLSRMIRRAKDGFILGFVVGNGDVSVSHL